VAYDGIQGINILMLWSAAMEKTPRTNSRGFFLCGFPKQVIVLESTSIISQLKGRRCGFTRRMIG
jgi:hypothetical protein